jgi:hypothetical protein
MTMGEENHPMEPGPGEVAGETFEPGKPAAPDRWRGKLRSRGDMLRYLRSGERYWYGSEWYGSERRRTKA